MDCRRRWANISGHHKFIYSRTGDEQKDTAIDPEACKTSGFCASRKMAEKIKKDIIHAGGLHNSNFNCFELEAIKTEAGVSAMWSKILTIEDIIGIVKPIAQKYHVKKIYLFGSYARGEASVDSDMDFLVYGGKEFKLTMIFAFAEDLRKALKKKVDVFEIHEINTDSEFYNAIMKERLRIA